MEWKPISTASFDRELELAVFDYDGTHVLVFPRRRIVGSWINAETKHRVEVPLRIGGMATSRLVLRLRIAAVRPTPMLGTRRDF